MSATLASFDSDSRSRLVAGLGFSLVAHLVFALAMIGRQGDPHPPAMVFSSLPPAQPEKPVFRPGVEHSPAVTINWLGFASPTEHQATPADTEQAALSPETPGLPTEPVEALAAQEPPLPLPEPTPERVAEAPAEAAATPTTPAPAEASARVAQDQFPAEPPPLLALRTDSPDLPTSPLLKIVQRSPAAAAADSAQPARTAAESATSAAPADPGVETDALPSEKESTATSRDEPIEWSPGRPVAAEGLDLTPVAPKFTVTTRVSAIPRNPVVRMDFGSDGRVKKAEYLPGQNTGYRDVDGPLLDALYRWTAKGRAIEELGAAEPGATVGFEMRIVLVRSLGTVRRGSADR